MFNFWYIITSWFNDLRDRRRILNDFNTASRCAFIEGIAPTLLEARVSSGDSAYRHEYSKFMSGGFRIKVMSGNQLSKSEMVEIGQVILSNDRLIRQLIALGWDTLEIHGSTGSHGLKWELRKFSKVGGVLNV